MRRWGFHGYKLAPCKRCSHDGGSLMWADAVAKTSREKPSDAVRKADTPIAREVPDRAGIAR
jgi:hypothetical protein